ncbi:glycosyltransferase family 2 protein [Salinimicrobium sp. CAU 1759]
MSPEEKFKEYETSKGEILWYLGEPALDKLETLAEGPGDLWHSSLDQGFTGIFPELKYQIAVFWWFLNDFEHLDQSVCWRINPYAFVVRKKVWEIMKGFPEDYESDIMRALDLGFRMLRYCGGVPMHINDLYPEDRQQVNIPASDRYLFFLKNFKKEHAINMLLKKGSLSPLQELKAYRKAVFISYQKNDFPLIPPRELKEVPDAPGVSVIIPTMFRQEYTVQLLKDYALQTYPVKEVVVVDATPPGERNEGIYKSAVYPFDLRVLWQKTKGSCRARNEAIEECTGDYIIFADDDTRIPKDFVENHLRLLHTYKVDACNGLDVMADNSSQDLNDLKRTLEEMGLSRWKAGAAQTFSNANSCVKRTLVYKLIGNDINFDGGYGEDSDFGFSLLEEGSIVIHNPFSVNLHLKPKAGGYRHWASQSAILGKKRKKQAWELDNPVGLIKPVPSPTIMYGIIKRFKKDQIEEYRSRYFFLYLWQRPRRKFLFRVLKLPYKIKQFNLSMMYAQNLLKRGERYR